MSEAEGGEQKDDVVAEWELNMADCAHRVTFEHGTTSGKRVVKVDGHEVFRKNWMFRLVGSQHFKIGDKECEIFVSNHGILFDYELRVDGGSLKKFTKTQAQNTRMWYPVIEGNKHRVVLDLQSMEVFADGQRMETTGIFSEEGTDTCFSLSSHPLAIRASSSGDKKMGLIYTMLLGNQKLHPEAYAEPYPC